MNDQFPTKEEIEEKLYYIIHNMFSDFIDTYCRWVVEQFIIKNCLSNYDISSPPTAYTRGANTHHYLISEMYYKSFVENAWNLTIIGFLDNKDSNNIVISYSDGLCTDGLIVTRVTEEGIEFLRNAYDIFINNLYIDEEMPIKNFIDKNKKVVGFKWIGFARAGDQEGISEIGGKYVLNYFTSIEDINSYFLYEHDKLYEFVKILLKDKSVFI